MPAISAARSKPKGARKRPQKGDGRKQSPANLQRGTVPAPHGGPPLGPYVVVHRLEPTRLELQRARAKPGESISAFLKRTSWKINRLPTICVVNGEPLLRVDWPRTRIKASDRVEFRSAPRDGDTGRVAGLVGLIALSVLATPIAGALLGPALAGTTIIGSLTVGQAAAGLVRAGGLAADATLLPFQRKPRA
jgi:sulfur carrier protein ThiS